MRLNKYLAGSGIASRRGSDALIEQGAVCINGKRASVGSSVNTKTDKVTVYGKEISLEALKVYYLFNKPLGVLTTLKDPQGRRTVKDYLQDIEERVFPVGRLDYDSEGLVFLTNDGALAHRVQHPRYKIDKVYEVEVDKKLSRREEDIFAAGVELEEGTTAPCKIVMIKPRQYRVTLSQGWNRQVRRMFDVFGLYVLSLKRIQIGPFLLEDLEEGRLRKASPEKIKELNKFFQEKI